MKYRTINIKDDHPSVDLALAILEIEIETAHFEGVRALKVIHGYGSHGVGGEIKRNLIPWLKRAKRRGIIADFIRGEECFISDSLKKIEKFCPEILGDADLYHINSGVTIILL